MTTKAIADIAQECYDFMSTDVGKEKILNPPGRKPIQKFEWHPHVFQNKVRERVSMYVLKTLKSQQVLQTFSKIKDEVLSFYQKTSLNLFDIESCWTEDREERIRERYVRGDDTEISDASLLGIFLATSPVWLPLLATGIGLTIVVSPILFPLIKFLGRKDRKNEIIDEEYNSCRSSFRDVIRKKLEANQGFVISKLLDKVTSDLVLRRIQSLKIRIELITKSRSEIIANAKSLGLLAQKIKSIDDSATALLEYFSQETGTQIRI